MLIRVIAIAALWVQYGNSVRDFIARGMMIAYDQINIVFRSVCCLIDGFDAAIKSNNQIIFFFYSIIKAFERYPVTFVIAVRNIIANVVIEAFKVVVYKRNRSSAINIVIAVNQDFLLVLQGFVQALNSLVHILHQKGIVQIVQAGTKKLPGLIKGFYVPLQKQGGKMVIYIQCFCQLADLLLICYCFQYPLPI